jgi:flagellar hook-associated protein 2
LASNLDTKSIISALMQADQQPLVRLQRRATTLTAQQTAYGTLNTALMDYLAKVQAFTMTSAGSARSATSADTSSLTATASSAAVPAQYHVSVDAIATSTRATSTGAIGAAVTNAAQALSALPMPGTATAGQIGFVIDGEMLSVTVGNPAVTTLQSVLDSVATAIQGKTGGTVTGSIVANRIQFSISGAGADHDVRFGLGSDTSNLLTLTGLSGTHVAQFGPTTGTLTGTALVGVVQAGGKLDSAGLTGLASTTTGVLTINGKQIAYNTTVDSLSTVLARINASQAGVVASLDRTGDHVVISNKASGPKAIDIADTAGTLGAALKLAPGTTNAQVIGQSAQVTVDGRTVVSESNDVSTAIDGLTLHLLDQSTGTFALTVGVDSAAIQDSLQALVTSYNSLADTVDSLTTHAQGQPAAPLEGDSTAETLGFSIRTMMMSIAPGLSGSIQSLADVGVNSGAVGAKPGTTSRLQLDTSKLSAALASDPVSVAQLLGSAGGITGPIVDRLKSLTKYGGFINSNVASIDDELRRNATDQTDAQARLDAKQATLEAKFANLEALLSQLQSQGSQVSAQVNAFNAKSG